jgi:uncharacterized protein
MESAFRYAYLHGFASSPQARKGQYLAARFAEAGLELELPDLNRPSFEKLTFTGALEVIDELSADDERPWRFVGSSMGGYLAARWASVNPNRVDRLVLLCPGFRLAERWPQLVGPRRMERWEREGELRLPGPQGEMTPVHWGFIEDARSHPPEPEVPCETIIIHGRRDPTVPIESSRAYSAAREQVELFEVDDMHGLIDSVEYIEEKIFEFFEIR